MSEVGEKRKLPESEVPECPICLELMETQIRTCQVPHNCCRECATAHCDSCMERGTTPTCPMCREDMPIIFYGARSLCQAIINEDLPALNQIIRQENIREFINHMVGKRNALMLAARYRYLNVARMLLDNGANVNIVAGGRTPLMLAVKHEYLDVVRLLLENGADVNTVAGGRTPLMLAVNNNNDEMVRELISRNADISQRVDGKTPIMLAAENGSLAMTRLLMQHKEDKYDTEAFCHYMHGPSHRISEATCFFEALRPRDPVNLRDGRRTLLDLVVEQSSYRLLEYLLKKYKWPQEIIDQTFSTWAPPETGEVPDRMALCLKLLRPGCVTRMMDDPREEGSLTRIRRPYWKFTK